MSNKTTQQKELRCAKYIKQYNLEYDIENNNSNYNPKQTPPTITSIEDSQISIKTVFTIVGVVISILVFCFSVYKEYNQNMMDIRLIHVQIITDIKQLDEKLERIINDSNTNNQRYKNKKY